MGMFDDFKFSLNLVKDLVDKNQLEILKSRDKKFFWGQTKDLDNVLSLYEIDRKKLYQYQHSAFDDVFEPVNFEPKDRTVGDKQFIKLTNYINVYDIIDHDDGQHSFEFRLHFVDGKLQSIHLHEYDFTSNEVLDKRLKELEDKLFNRNKGIKNKIKRKLSDAVYGIYRYLNK